MNAWLRYLASSTSSCRRCWDVSVFRCVCMLLGWCFVAEICQVGQTNFTPSSRNGSRFPPSVLPAPLQAHKLIASQTRVGV